MLKKIVEKMLFYPKVIITIYLSLSVISIFLILNFLEVDTSTDALINKKLFKLLTFFQTFVLLNKKFWNIFI